MLLCLGSSVKVLRCSEFTGMGQVQILGLYCTARGVFACQLPTHPPPNTPSFFGGLSPFFGLPGGPLGMAWGLGSNIHRDKKGRTDDPERANLEKSRLDQVLCNCLNMGSKAWLSGDVGIDGCTVDKQN